MDGGCQLSRLGGGVGSDGGCWSGVEGSSPGKFLINFFCFKYECWHCGKQLWFVKFSILVVLEFCENI